jgi:hypothetical protein
VNRRDWLKALTWELTSFVVTWLMAVAYFKSFDVTLFAVLLTVFKIPFYVLHANIWRRYR